ncbi:MAG: ECF transporter S component [Chloroflexota bacterium]
MNEKKRGLAGWKTRDLLVTAVISIVFGLLLLPVNILDVWLQSFAILFAPLAYGLWAIPAILVMYIVRRPGAAILTLFLAGIVQIPFNPYGWLIVVTQLLTGVICELTFTVTRYRRFTLPILMISGVVMALFTHMSTYAAYGLANLSVSLQILMVLFAVASGVFAGWLAKTIGDAIAQTGVLNNFILNNETAD